MYRVKYQPPETKFNVAKSRSLVRPMLFKLSEKHNPQVSATSEAKSSIYDASDSITSKVTTRSHSEYKEIYFDYILPEASDPHCTSDCEAIESTLDYPTISPRFTAKSAQELNFIKNYNKLLSTRGILELDKDIISNEGSWQTVYHGGIVAQDDVFSRTSPSKLFMITERNTILNSKFDAERIVNNLNHEKAADDGKSVFSSESKTNYLRDNINQPNFKAEGLSIELSGRLAGTTFGDSNCHTNAMHSGFLSEPDVSISSKRTNERSSSQRESDISRSNEKGAQGGHFKKQGKEDLKSRYAR